MAVFRSPAKQAASVMRELQGTILKSVRTVENYERGLTRVTEWTQREKLSDGLRGKALGVSSAGALRVRTEAGVREINSAEVSVRPLATAGGG